jgi:hypothetical protein
MSTETIVYPQTLTGTVRGNSSNPDWDLNRGPGERLVKRYVSFAQGVFTKAPAVMVALSLMDTGNRANTRVEAYAENVSQSGFNMVFRTWSDSVTHGLSATWIATGS